MKKIFTLLLTALALLALMLGSSLPVGAASPNAAVTAVAVAVKPALLIKAPVSARTGDPVSVTVYEMKNNEPAVGAKVWALLANSIPATISSQPDIPAYAIKYGIFLGETDKNGQVTGKFEKTGSYILVAVKDGYQPGLAKISIIDGKALVIRAPQSVKAGEPFSLSIVEKSVLTVEIPVAKAGVWAIDISKITATAAVMDIPTVTQKQGMFLGYTDEKGYLEPPPVLKQPGTYYLVALKDGYLPATAKIFVSVSVTITPPPPTVTATAKPPMVTATLLPPTFAPIPKPLILPTPPPKNIDFTGLRFTVVQNVLPVPAVIKPASVK